MSSANGHLPTKQGVVPHEAGSQFHKLDYPPLASDLLRGVREITRFVYGTDERSAIRSVYHLTSGRFPSFKLGSMTCALKSTIRASIWMQQRKRAWRGHMEEEFVRLHVLLSGILALLAERNGHSGGDRDDTQLRALLTEGTKTIREMIEMDRNDDRGEVQESGR